MSPKQLNPTVLTTCRLIEFQEARIEEVSADFNPYLMVSGLKAYANMRVELLPRTYAVQPDYWGIEVVGCLTQIALPAVHPFEVVLALNFPVGKKGIRIIGANNTSKVIDFSYTEKDNPDDGGKDEIVYGPDRPRA